MKPMNLEAKKDVIGVASPALLAVVVAGGRDYRITGADEAWLDTLPIREVVSGGATGTDAGGDYKCFWLTVKLTRQNSE